MNLRLLVLLFLAFPWTQCSKEQTAPVQTQSITAKIDGTDWKADLTNTLVLKEGNTLFLLGVASDGSHVEIYLGSASVGTTVVKGGSAATINDSFVRHLTSENYMSTFVPQEVAGEVTISALDQTSGTVSGTFHSVVTQVPISKTIPTVIRSITEGVFTNMKFKVSQIQFTIPDLPMNVAFAKVDGGSNQAFALSLVEMNSATYGATYSNNSVPGNFLSISLYFPANVLPGSYSIANGTDYAAAFTKNSTRTDATSGTLTIVSHSTKGRIEGTFSFTAGAAVITGGSFGATN